MDKNVLDVLNNYSWPGNIRELKNLIERLCIVSEEDLVNINDLPDYLQVFAGKYDHWIGKITQGDNTLKKIIEMVEKEVFKAAYIKYKNSYSVAEALGISQPTAYRKMKKYL